MSFVRVSLRPQDGGRVSLVRVFFSLGISIVLGAQNDETVPSNFSLEANSQSLAAQSVLGETWPVLLLSRIMLNLSASSCVSSRWYRSTCALSAARRRENV